MQRRKLGRTGLDISPIAIGAAAVELTPDELREIDTAMAQIAVQGGRY